MEHERKPSEIPLGWEIVASRDDGSEAESFCATCGFLAIWSNCDGNIYIFRPLCSEWPQ
jgi:hypothetical protein